MLRVHYIGWENDIPEDDEDGDATDLDFLKRSRVKLLCYEDVKLLLLLNSVGKTDILVMEATLNYYKAWKRTQIRK